jgi:hypothetical protein
MVQLGLGQVHCKKPENQSYLKRNPTMALFIQIALNFFNKQNV